MNNLNYYNNKIIKKGIMTYGEFIFESNNM